MNRFLITLMAFSALALTAQAKTIGSKKKEGSTEFTFAVKSEQIEKAGADTIRFPIAIISSEPLQAKDFTYQAIAAQIKLNCKDGSGEVSSLELFKGPGTDSTRVARGTAVLKIVGAQHAYLGKDLAFSVCQEAALMDLVSQPGAAVRPAATVGGVAPSTLELRVLQSRIYEASYDNFLKAMKEICANGGGNFIPVGRSELNCIGSKMSLFSDFVSGVGTFTVEVDAEDKKSVGVRPRRQRALPEVEVEEEDKKSIGVRIRVTDGLSRPTYDRRIYEGLFKELSEALGVLDISIQRKKAE